MVCSEFAHGMQTCTEHVLIDLDALGVAADGYGMLHSGDYREQMITWFTGSFSTAGNLITTLDSSNPETNYARWLDMDQAVVRTSWNLNGTAILR